MFKRSRRKIVSSIMSILVLLWVGTLGVIYASSYFEMKQQNEQLLRSHAQMYTLSQSFEDMLPPVRPMPGGNPGSKPGFDPDSPRFQLSTFYAVAVSYAGDVLEITGSEPGVYSDSDLEALAKRILSDGADTGVHDRLSFLVVDKGGYMLVTFMDNTVVHESAMTLFRYTLIIGAVALVLFFFLARFLAKRIVAPLEESYQKQKQFISDAGHELKTPVSIVSANAELLSRQLGDNQWLQNIQYENGRMALLVGQLLELARTEHVTPRMEHIDLSRLADGEALPFESVAFEKGLVLHRNITGGIAVEGSSSQLKQLISILLDNAIRHSPDGGAVHLRLTREHSTAELSVTNPGDEIPPEQREKIFERFYRMDSARNGEDHHYGLGLAIAKAITDTHRGRIRVYCDHGLVEFRVSLPIAKEKSTSKN